MPIEISQGKVFHINSQLIESQQETLIQVLQEKSKYFTWNYHDMKGIHPDTFYHQIYTQSDAYPTGNPKSHMNPALKLVKYELQNPLDAKFIYPIFYSIWISPIIIVPQNECKWYFFLDYQELKKSTMKYFFPLPFIDQVIEILVGKNHFSFLDDFSGYK